MKAYLRRRNNQYSLVVENEEYAVHHVEWARNVMDKALGRQGLTAHGMIDKVVNVERRRDGFYCECMRVVEVRDYAAEINDLLRQARAAGFSIDFVYAANKNDPNYFVAVLCKR